MRGFGLLLALLVVFAAPLRAQQIVARSGEHGSFTRLVFDMPDGSDWEIDSREASEGIRISFSGAQTGIDVSRVFDRIDRSRIASVSVVGSGPTVAITLNCACSTEAFVAKDNMLVIDVAPAPSPDPQAEEMQTSGSRKEFTRIRVGSTPGVGPPLKASDNLLKHDFTPSLEDISTSDGPTEFERHLAEQLATAATRGLLTAATRLTTRSLSEGKPRAEQMETAGKRESTATTFDRLSESLHAEVGFESGEARLRIGGDRCVQDRELDLAAWADEDRDFRLQIGELRRELYGEFDRFNPEIAERLARRYIHFGLGSEAMRIVDLDPMHSDPVLVALARLVEGGQDTTGVFAAQTSCDGRAALWALLGSRSLPSLSTINTSAILRSFEELPVNLRRHLGPALAGRLAEEGQADEGRNLLARLERATGVYDEDMTFQGARIDRMSGAVETARPILEDLAVSDAPNAPEALEAAVEIASEHGERVPERVIDLSAAYAMEFRGSELGDRMRLTNLRALATNEEFEEGFSALGTTEDIASEYRTLAIEALYSALVRKAEDPLFLRFAAADDPGHSEALSNATVRDTVARLLDVGLPELAADWLAASGERLPEQVRGMLLARIHLSRMNPEDAENALDGLDGGDVAALRAQARGMMGDFDYVQTTMEEIGAPEDARDAAWLAGDWTRVAGTGDDALSLAAGLMSDPGDNLPDGVPGLQVAESIADDSAAARDAVTRLLEETRVDEN
ncbi:hypothetical protein [Salipiger mucosus]|uniref:Uncharacterized protein n=1 Tax=Salipiger mucosus DSM 16094 TaxID=1123237 RepID=S9QSK7_9RHOB|nr:hypothetical protein [Salipiger mucosus]EPX82628.1 hypothetical protein Salmuc_00947 [Salipiger mucosus DSM 16094]